MQLPQEKKSLNCLGSISENVYLKCSNLKVTSAIKHRKTAEEIIIYTHRVYSLLLKLERNKV